MHSLNLPVKQVTLREGVGEAADEVVELVLVIMRRKGKWRGGNMSKRDVCKEVLIYLAKNGFEDQACDWKGVEQQTGQGIIEEAEELQRQVGDPGNESEAESFVAQAKTKTEGNTVPTFMNSSR
ncbi:hypothetical protein PCANC_08473 [Puccinia coronata f. sp. avenae]|uniref:Uncharacterized protein n=1 Tax=Puccinia coronata f. sp. avenae TaxID=200324 RepID=A0A2N5T4C3_9BASI|nr:hypothetical protein PCANC_08473 [Puccinia coronata f. sp. avenae]